MIRDTVMLIFALVSMIAAFDAMGAHALSPGSVGANYCLDSRASCLSALPAECDAHACDAPIEVLRDTTVCTAAANTTCVHQDFEVNYACSIGKCTGGEGEENQCADREPIDCACVRGACAPEIGNSTHCPAAECPVVAIEGTACTYKEDDTCYLGQVVEGQCAGDIYEYDCACDEAVHVKCHSNTWWWVLVALAIAVLIIAAAAIIAWLTSMRPTRYVGDVTTPIVYASKVSER